MNVREPDGEPDELGSDELGSSDVASSELGSDDVSGSDVGSHDTADPAELSGDAESGHDTTPQRPKDLDDASVDAAFADIVAWWKTDTGAPQDQPDDEHPAENTNKVGRRADDSRDAMLDRTEALRRERVEREIDFAVDGPGGGHYVPPEPARLPRLDLITLLAWVAVLAGPLLLVLAALLESQGIGMPDWVVAVAVAATIVGFVVLASRLPRRGDNDPDDDGAVV